MSNIIDSGSLAAALANAQRFPFFKASLANATAGVAMSLWTAAGNPDAGAAPGSADGVCPDNTTQGALKQADAGAGTNHLLRFSAVGANAGTLLIYDRLWCNSGLDGNSTSLQSWTFPGLTRSTGGAGVELWIDCYTQLGATSRTINASATGAAGAITPSATIPATMRVGQCVRFSGANMEGLTAVSDCTIQTGGTGTTGNFGLTLRRLICDVPLAAANVSQVQQAISAALALIDAGACLELLIIPTTTTSGNVSGLVVVG